VLVADGVTVTVLAGAVTVLGGWVTVVVVVLVVVGVLIETLVLDGCADVVSVMRSVLAAFSLLLDPDTASAIATPIATTATTPRITVQGLVLPPSRVPQFGQDSASRATGLPQFGQKLPPPGFEPGVGGLGVSGGYDIR
jgi:hypothetical protein